MNFLESVAHDLYRRFAGRFEDVVVVFPNMRSRLFFDRYLREVADRTIFTPQYTDLSSLFTSVQKSVVADDILLIATLFKVYRRVIKEKKSESSELLDETFDDFFFFGEIILSDFQDLDKYLIEAEKVYRDMADLERLSDTFEHISKEQQQAIEKFFGQSADRTMLQRRFVEMWEVLGDVYREFRAELKQRGIAYAGMIERDVVENFGFYEDRFDKKYVFVGFNVLSNTEYALFRKLHRSSLFYWDYDDFYLKDTLAEAGRFIRKNLQDFPMPDGFVLETNNLVQEKTIKIVSSPTDISQVSYIPEFLQGLGADVSNKPNTAIVFCDEKLLLPALQFTPNNVDKVNITMGYPISQTPIFDFVQRIIAMENSRTDTVYRYEELLSVLSHKYAEYLIDNPQSLIGKIIEKRLFYFDIDKNPDCQSSLLFQMRFAGGSMKILDYLRVIVTEVGRKEKTITDKNGKSIVSFEAIFKVYQILNRLYDLIEKEHLELSQSTLVMLLLRLLSTRSIAFHGEPAVGLQLMGVLETRNMDFDNLMILSLGEGVMPKAELSPSFIPIFMRNALGMSSLRHQDSMLAYYFYRLIQRAKNITLLYGKQTGKTSKAEPSRFLMQCQTELKNIHFHKIDISSNTDSKNEFLSEQPKTESDRKQLLEQKCLSPSAINTYINCPMKFYFSYIKNLQSTEDFTDELDSSLIGTIIHKAVENFYKTISEDEEFEFTADIICQNIKKGLMADSVRKAFAKEYFNTEAEIDIKTLNGEQKLYFAVAEKMVGKLLDFDMGEAPFRIIVWEKGFYTDYCLRNGEKIKIGGFIDRIRVKNGEALIDDFKTGPKPSPEFPKWENLFEPLKYNKASDYNRQVLLYRHVFQIKEPNYPNVHCGLLYIPNLNKNSEVFLSDKSEKFRDNLGEFWDCMSCVIDEIFDDKTPFRMSESVSYCQYCDFRRLCGR